MAFSTHGLFPAVEVFSELPPTFLLRRRGRGVLHSEVTQACGSNCPTNCDHGASGNRLVLCFRDQLNYGRTVMHRQVVIWSLVLTVVVRALAVPPALTTIRDEKTG